MSVWIVQPADYGGNICGVYSSVEIAKQAILDSYANNVVFKSNGDRIQASTSTCSDIDYQVFRYDIDPIAEPPSRKRKRHLDTPIGFLKMYHITNELADFFGVDHGTHMNRGSCTERLVQYIKVNNLQNPNDRRQILPDKNLTELWGSTVPDDPCYFYTLQKLVTLHLLE
uniref:SWIB/MDM2 domain protein n=1 Tax=Marseillevirus LCMAC201 TaxID=2506605 RepID=A0A481YX27_9VIRU|nr:MAG: SWIB/MDM2 domain protein [Marseillevirus LCMAC201]